MENCLGSSHLTRGGVPAAGQLPGGQALHLRPDLYLVLGMHPEDNDPNPASLGQRL